MDVLHDLEEALQFGDVKKFKKLLKLTDDNVFSTILFKCSSQFIDFKFTEEILNYIENDLKLVSEYWLCRALCAASLNHNIKLLSYLRKRGVQTENVWAAESALLACCYGSNKWTNYFPYLSALLSTKDVNLNVLCENGKWVIEKLVKRNLNDVVEILLTEAGYHLLLDVKTAPWRSTPRQKIYQFCPKLHELLNGIPTHPFTQKINSLLNLLWNDDQIAFVEEVQSLHPIVDCRILLYWAAERCLPDAFQALLRKMKLKRTKGFIVYTIYDYRIILSRLASDSTNHSNRMSCLRHFGKYVPQEHMNILLHAFFLHYYSTLEGARKFHIIGNCIKTCSLEFILYLFDLGINPLLSLENNDRCEILKGFLDSMIIYNEGDYKLSFTKLRCPPRLGTVDFSKEEWTEKATREIQFLHRISKKEKFRTLLSHPVLTCFTYLKWQRVRPLFYANLFTYTFFCILLAAYFIFVEAEIVLNEKRSEASEEVITNNKAVLVLRIFLLITTALISLREIGQFLTRPRDYFISWENWLETSIIALTIVTVILEEAGSHEAFRHFAAFLIPLASFELFLLCGRHPSFSMKVEMMKKVTITFSTFFDLVLFLNITFAFSFHVMFLYESSIFENFWRTLFKTIVMMTGEFDAGSDGDLPFDATPGTSHIIFLLFVCLTTVILMNLLVGLAIADVQQIKEEAYTYSCAARINFINIIEVGLLKLKETLGDFFLLRVVLKHVFVFNEMRYNNTSFCDYHEPRELGDISTSTANITLVPSIFRSSFKTDESYWDFNNINFSVDDETLKELEEIRLETTLKAKTDKSKCAMDCSTILEQLKHFETRLDNLEEKMDVKLQAVVTAIMEIQNK